ncbi:MAG: F0F1 ATP synthase subunit A [Pelagibacteraceae bacterium]|nr:F0F1 ATP synthase subunit A [Pelagibacteraceae bacterium]|tara:strand:- start:5496 stop:6218 length:723 start_codon:yes stop_codon:yes gene_type:complete
MADPIHQFEIKKIIPIEINNIDLSFTNSSLFMMLTVLFISIFLISSIKKKKIIPTRLQSVSEIFYEFIANMINDNIGNKGQKFFPLIFTLFTFILFGNLLGLLPYSFTFTSHIIVTFVMAMFIFLFVTLIGIMMHGFKFFGLFVPKGVPMAMLPLMVPIEIISYLSRPVSLSIRLFANMMAGHTMLKVFAGFIFSLGLFGIAPLIVDVALTAFEVLVAFLQAYVFTVLTCLYLNDAINLH